jgi:hypothetical protein
MQRCHAAATHAFNAALPEEVAPVLASILLDNCVHVGNNLLPKHGNTRAVRAAGPEQIVHRLDRGKCFNKYLYSSSNATMLAMPKSRYYQAIKYGIQFLLQVSNMAIAK